MQYIDESWAREHIRSTKLENFDSKAQFSEVLVVIPTYCEAQNLPLLLRVIRQVAAVDILIIDDNSPDGTGKIADDMCRNMVGLRVHRRPYKQGIGSAHLFGLSLGLKEGYKIILTMDGDFTHDPKDVPRFVSEMNHHGETDIVVGSRYGHKEGIRDWSVARKLITNVAHLCTKLVLGIPFDATGGFRAYRASALSRVDFGSIQSDGYSFMFEMLFRCVQHGLRVKEIPVTLSLRQSGHSKISRAEIIRAIVTLARLGTLRLCNWGIKTSVP